MVEEFQSTSLIYFINRFSNEEKCKYYLVEIKWKSGFLCSKCNLKNQLEKRSHEIQNIQITNARYFDIKNKFSDAKSEFPSAYPSKAQFEIESQKLGINNESIIVVYDANGIYSSPRA